MGSALPCNTAEAEEFKICFRCGTSALHRDSSYCYTCGAPLYSANKGSSVLSLQDMYPPETQLRADLLPPARGISRGRSPQPSNATLTMHGDEQWSLNSRSEGRGTEHTSTRRSLTLPQTQVDLDTEGLDDEFMAKLHHETGISDLNNLLVATPDEIDYICKLMKLSLDETLRFRLALRARQSAYENYLKERDMRKTETKNNGKLGATIGFTGGGYLEAPYSASPKRLSDDETQFTVKVGDWLQCRDSDGEEWQYGRVTDVGPVMIQANGTGQARIFTQFEFIPNEVEAVNMQHQGERHELRTASELPSEYPDEHISQRNDETKYRSNSESASSYVVNPPPIPETVLNSDLKHSNQHLISTPPPIPDSVLHQNSAPQFFPELIQHEREI